MTIPPHRDSPVGVVVTLPEIYKKVLETDSKVDKVAEAITGVVAVNDRLDSHSQKISGQGERLRKIESQVAAQWIIVGIVITVVGAALVKFILG